MFRILFWLSVVMAVGLLVADVCCGDEYQVKAAMAIAKAKAAHTAGVCDCHVTGVCDCYAGECECVACRLAKEKADLLKRIEALETEVQALRQKLAPKAKLQYYSLPASRPAYYNQGPVYRSAPVFQGSPAGSVCST